jgi:hypothetical protein
MEALTGPTTYLPVLRGAAAQQRHQRPMPADARACRPWWISLRRMRFKETWCRAPTTSRPSLLRQKMLMPCCRSVRHWLGRVKRTRRSALWAVWRSTGLLSSDVFDSLLAQFLVAEQQMVFQGNKSGSGLCRVVVRPARLCNLGHLGGRPCLNPGHSRFGFHDPLVLILRRLFLLHVRQFGLFRCAPLTSGKNAEVPPLRQMACPSACNRAMSGFVALVPSTHDAASLVRITLLPAPAPTSRTSRTS